MNNKKSIIYKAFCMSTGKSYVGQTVKKFSYRMREHYRHAFYYGTSTKFYNALRKYGYENFIWEILCEDICVRYTEEYESFFIDFYSSARYGYNSSSGAGYCNFWDYIDEEKAQKLKHEISILRKGKTYEELYGNQKAKQIKKQLSLSQKSRTDKRICSEEHRKKISLNHANVLGSNNPFYGRKHTKETKQSMSFLKKEYYKTHNGYWMNKYHSDKTKKKISKSKCKNSDFFYVIFKDEILGKFNNQHECAREYSLNPVCISRCLRKLQKKHKGFTFQYE